MVTCLGSECFEKESYLLLHVFLKASKRKDLAKGIIYALDCHSKDSKKNLENYILRILLIRDG